MGNTTQKIFKTLSFLCLGALLCSDSVAGPRKYGKIEKNVSDKSYKLDVNGNKKSLIQNEGYRDLIKSVDTINKMEIGLETLVENLKNISHEAMERKNLEQQIVQFNKKSADSKVRVSRTRAVFIAECLKNNNKICALMLQRVPMLRQMKDIEKTIECLEIPLKQNKNKTKNKKEEILSKKQQIADLEIKEIAICNAIYNIGKKIYPQDELKALEFHSENLNTESNFSNGNLIINDTPKNKDIWEVARKFEEDLKKARENSCIAMGNDNNHECTSKDMYEYACLLCHQSKGKNKEMMEKMIQLFKKSAQQDYSPATYVMGILYMTGTDVEKDEQAGLILIKRAAVAGYQTAIEHLEALKVEKTSKMLNSN